MKFKSFVKKYGILIIAALLFVYGCGVSMLYLYRTGRLGEKAINIANTGVERPYVEGKKEKQYSIEKNGIDSSNLLGESVDGDNSLLIVPSDYENILTLYNLPELERMEASEDEEIVDSMQVILKIEKLGVRAKDYQTPELNYKNIYNDINTYMAGRDYSNYVEFDGESISELNSFLVNLSNVYVKLTKDRIEWDRSLIIPDNIAIDAEGVEFYSDEDINKLIHIVDGHNISIVNFNIENLTYEFGLFVVNSHGISFSNSKLSGCYGKSVSVLGTNDYIELKNNVIEKSGHGAVILNGDIRKVLLDNNRVVHTLGSDNFSAGIVMSSVDMTDYSTCFNPYIENSISEHLRAPHDCVVINNYIADGSAAGIYSDGSYGNYFINNTLYLNDKEGICLDQGTVLCYVSGNSFDGNGSRRKMSQEELDADFVGEYGLAADGTSPAKLPGISLDNAAYNIISNNIVKNNSGSGIKMVRSAARNILMNNVVLNNNQGENDSFHFYGIELGYNAKPDYETTTIDFTACFENIVCGNIINGEHYSGIYIAPECYTNDFFDNVIMRSTWYSIESRSEKYNATANNMSDINSYGIDLSIQTDGIVRLPGVSQ